MTAPTTGDRVLLGAYPTAIQALDALCPLSSVQLYCKREDRSASLYGGNKVRKLEHVLAELEPGQPILTVGAVGSHHVVATALYGSERGHPCYAVLGPQPDTPHVRQQGRVSAGLLAGYHAIARWSELPLALLRMEARCRQETGRSPHHLPPGGSSVTGTMGAVDLGLELARDVALGRLPRPDHVFVAVGSGGTAAGLWVGLRAAGLETQVEGVRVAPRALLPWGRLRALAGSAARRLPGPLATPLGHNPLRLHDEHLGPGYGHATPEGREAARLAQERCGLQLELTYTAKALAACLDQVRRHQVAGVVVYVDTVSSAPLQPLLDRAPDALPADLEAALEPATA